jgi:hypothetical protein
LLIVVFSATTPEKATIFWLQWLSRRTLLNGKQEFSARIRAAARCMKEGPFHVETRE